MMKKLIARYLNKKFPNETYTPIGSGRKSSAFRTDSGKIIRFKSLWRGTYQKEAKILRFIRQNGGIECEYPTIEAFTMFPFAFSVHNDFGGDVARQDLNLDELAPEVHKEFICKLTKSLIDLQEVGKKPNARKIIKRKKLLFLRQIRYFFFLLQKKSIFWKWLKLQRAYAKKRPPLVLTHNDLHFRNIIVDDDFNLVGLIDFENILFRPFEYNLRILNHPIRDSIIDYWKQTGIEVDKTVLCFYRVESLLSRMIKPSNRKIRPLLFRELDEVLDEFILSQG